MRHSSPFPGTSGIYIPTQIQIASLVNLDPYAHLTYTMSLATLAGRVGFPQLKRKYEKIDGSGKEEQRPHDPEVSELENGEEVSQRKEPGFLGTRKALVATCLLLAAVILVTPSVLALNQANRTDHQPRQGRACGNTSSEALSNGCTFDQLLWAWLPPSCPHYANDEFVAAEDWVFYVDPYTKEKTTPETWEKAMNNEIGLWGEMREHLTHCVYMLLSVGQVV